VSYSIIVGNNLAYCCIIFIIHDMICHLRLNEDIDIGMDPTEVDINGGLVQISSAVQYKEFYKVY